MSAPYKIPSGTRVYAIGDIHGMRMMLDKLHELISEDITKNPVLRPVIVYLGDYIDRGENSKAVLESLVEQKNRPGGLSRAATDMALAHKTQAGAACVERHYLLGNHEDAFLGYMTQPHAYADWAVHGGIETMRDYGITFDRAVELPDALEKSARQLKQVVPQGHISFLSDLKLHLTVGDYFFVHAGINPNIPLSEQTKKELTTIRKPFLSCKRKLPKKVIHGHTPVKEPEIKMNRINVDTGAVYGGALSCVVLEGSDHRFLQVF